MRTAAGVLTFRAAPSSGFSVALMALADLPAPFYRFTRHLASELQGTGVTANVIHPGDVTTEIWAEIKAASQRLGAIAEPFVQCAEWVQQTGGDDPEEAADLVINLMRDDAAGINGRFLWVDGGLQSPIASWGEPGELEPWRK